MKEALIYRILEDVSVAVRTGHGTWDEVGSCMISALTVSENDTGPFNGRIDNHVESKSDISEEDKMNDDRTFASSQPPSKAGTSKA
ncbi:hypothetical protein BCON_0115g00120 [Botryotinia convoluta]|uniref:Uncharacterized protein n=1 Tax=Botryotinia convoluta TaxID=54673 RepID=A0A4Z1HXH8_9HELO|nr:hypothetical protein BCON_0115g00120 [Botryotinia convoluta]